MGPTNTQKDEVSSGRREEGTTSPDLTVWDTDPGGETTDYSSGHTSSQASIRTVPSRTTVPRGRRR